MYKSYRAYKPHPNYVNPNITNTVGVQFRVNISDPNTWKGNKTHTDVSNNLMNAGAPTDSRPPLIPVSGSGPLYRRGKVTAAPNPIRHWRKQLQPQQGVTSGRAGVGQIMDRPGGSTIFTDYSKNNNCNSKSCQPFLPTYVPENYVKPLNIDNCWNATSNIYAPTIVKKIICDPEHRARMASRYASTNLSKKYYTTGKAYLRSRVKLLEQNQTLSQIPGNTYARFNTGGGGLQPIAANNYVAPSDSKTTGSQLYNSTYCVEDASACCLTTCQTHIIYKPNNYLFAVQGAVTSSSRIARLKYNAITKNHVDFLTLDSDGKKTNLSVDGQELPGSTPILYRGNMGAPYFIKSKYQLPNACNAGSSSNRKNSIAGLYPGGRMPSGGAGIKTVCFPQTLITV